MSFIYGIKYYYDSVVIILDNKKLGIYRETRCFLLYTDLLSQGVRYVVYDKTRKKYTLKMSWSNSPYITIVPCRIVLFEKYNNIGTDAKRS